MNPEFTKLFKSKLAKTFEEQLKALYNVYARLNKIVVMFIAEISLNQKIEDVYINEADIYSIYMDILRWLNIEKPKNYNELEGDEYSKNLSCLQNKLEISNVNKYDFSILLKLLAEHRTNQNIIWKLYLCKLTYKDDNWDSFLEKFMQIYIELSTWPTLFDEANC